MQPVSLILAVPRPSLCPTTGIHLPLQPVPSVSLYRRRPGVGENLALAPSLPAGTTKEGRGRSRPRTRLRPRPARLLACSPARFLARFLASPRLASPRFESPARKSPTTRSPALLARLLASPSSLVHAPREPYALRDPRECPCEGWREARARSRTGVPITRKHASPPRFSRASFKRLTFHPVTLFLAIGVRRGKGFRMEFLWMVIHAYICMYVYFCWSKSRRSVLRGM